MTQTIIKPQTTSAPFVATKTLEQRVEALEKKFAMLEKHNAHFFVEEKVPVAAKAETKESSQSALVDAVKTDQERMTGTQSAETLEKEKEA